MTFRAKISSWNPARASVEHAGIGSLHFGPEDLVPRLTTADGVDAPPVAWTDGLRGRTVSYTLETGAFGKQNKMTNVRLV